MANDLTSNPWSVDTAGTLSVSNFRVQKMRWHANAADNDLVVTHSDGKALWPIRAITGASSNESVGIEELDFGPEGFPCRGLTVQVIDGGTLYVYVCTST